CVDRPVTNARLPPSGRMSAAIIFGDAFPIPTSEPLVQGLPCVLHGLKDGLPCFIECIARPKILDRPSGRPRQLRVECWRNEVSLARIIGSERMTVTLSVLLK